jgi:pimeloyl-ACP methyl ester carboxylesterase
VALGHVSVLNDAFSDHWQHGEHVHFPDSGHFIMAEQFERFVEVLSRFLSAH